MQNSRTISWVRMHPAGRLHEVDPGELAVNAGDRVVVDLDPGQTIARVMPKGDGEHRKGGPVRKVVRLATDEDLARDQRNRERGDTAYRFCMAKIQERRLPMRMVRVEYLFDSSKAVFYFTAEGRVDFRELVKDLTRELNTRIEMRQIGVRDAAKKLGGHGPCGQELCCSTWLVDFSPVSVRMAKDQSLSLNPSKLSGLCGRLKCCLAYEHATYAQLKSLLPKLGSRYQTDEGVGKVIKQDILGLKVTVERENGQQEEIRIPLPESLPPVPAPSKGSSRSHSGGSGRGRSQQASRGGGSGKRTEDRKKSGRGRGPARPRESTDEDDPKEP